MCWRDDLSPEEVWADFQSRRRFQTALREGRRKKMAEETAEIPEKYLEHMTYAMGSQDVAEGDEPHVTLDGNKITFAVQAGPRKEYGENGCQIDEVIAWCRGFLISCNKAFPSTHTESAIVHMGSALEELEERTKCREDRGVEGTDQA